MATLLSVIEDYSPPNEQVGVPLRSTIEIEFNCLMDENSIEEAFFLEGPDTDSVIGPDSHASIWPSAFGTSLGVEEDFLTSPGYQGLVAGAFSFETADSKTTMTFTPTQYLAATTSYTANITDCYKRSVGDTVDGVGNEGNGEVTFIGPWLGGNDTANIRITASGVAGIAEFIWWKDSDPLTTFGPLLSTRRNSITLEAGLYIDFGAGSFYEDDEFSAELSTAVLCSGHLTFDFDTGSGSISALPTTSSSSILSALRQAETGSTSPLTIVRTIPDDHEAQVDPDTSQIIIEFNKEIDEDSVSEAMFEIESSVASSHPVLGAAASGTLAKRITVSGRRIIISI